MEKHITYVVFLIIVFAEIIFNFNSVFGAFIYFFLISASLLLLSEEKIDPKYYELLIIITIIPLVRVLYLFIDVGYIYRMGLIYAIMLFLGIYYSRKFKVNLGFKVEHLWFLPFVIVIGGLIGFVGDAFVLFREPLLIYLLPLVSISQEIYFRGLLQNKIEEVFGTVYSLLIPSLLLFVLVFSFGFFVSLYLLLISLFSSVIYNNTRNIILTIILNLAANYFLFVF